MSSERRYVEEVGEAVEALGVMLERELAKITQGLAEIHRIIVQMRDEAKNVSQEIQKLKEEMTKDRKLVPGLESALSRTELKLTELERIPWADDDAGEELRNDLLTLKKELQFARSDLKELLRRQDDLESKLTDWKERKERFDG
jgi:chromosome segregation ATPase